MKDTWKNISGTCIRQDVAISFDSQHKWNFIFFLWIDQWLVGRIVSSASYADCNPIRNIPRTPLIVSNRGLAEFRLLYNSILVTGLRWRFNTISIGTAKILSHPFACVPIDPNRIMLKENEISSGSKKWPQSMQRVKTKSIIYSNLV